MPLAALVEEMRLGGFPAVHHSEAYTDAYHPAYRVVALSSLPEDFSMGGSVYLCPRMDYEWDEPPLPST